MNQVADVELFIRAVNADNKSELMQLISLISRALTPSEQEREAINNPRFVRACLSSKFISLVACIEGRPIAHLAYGINQNEHVQIFLPVIDPDFRELSTVVEEKFREILMLEAQKKGWLDFDVQHPVSPYALKLENLPQDVGSYSRNQESKRSPFAPLREWGLK